MTYTIIIWRQFTVYAVLFSVLMGCSGDVKHDVPDLENLTVISEAEDGLQTMSLTKEMEFRSSQAHLIARVGQFDVDRTGRVFIADVMQHNVHVFDSNGDHQTSFGREGSGPGEFRAMGALNYTDGTLYVYDPLMMRLNGFSIDTFDDTSTMYTQAINKRDVDHLSGLIQGGFVFINPTAFLVKFGSRLVPNPDYDGYNLNDTYLTYHIMDNQRRLQPSMIFRKPNYRALSATVGGQYRFTLFEFLGETLISTSENSIYMARSDEFLIQVFNLDGSYKRAYYVPYQNETFTREAAIRQQLADYDENISEWRVSVIEHAPSEQIPDTWPALNDLLVDDNNRLWVSTIVEDVDVNEWWVLKENGELITKFEWPRDEPIEVIKNGKMYTRQTDEQTGLERIVRYRVEFEEVE